MRQCISGIVSGCCSENEVIGKIAHTKATARQKLRGTPEIGILEIGILGFLHLEQAAKRHRERGFCASVFRILPQARAAAATGSFVFD